MTALQPLENFEAPTPDQPPPPNVKLAELQVRFMRLLTAGGLLLSLVLLGIHVDAKIDAAGFDSLCGPGSACEKLANAPTSQFLGIPWAIWGVGYFAFQFFVSQEPALATRKRLLQISAAASILSLPISLWLISQLVVSLDGLCHYCLVTHLTNLCLVANMVSLARRVQTNAGQKQRIWFGYPVCLTLVLLALTQYLLVQSQTMALNIRFQQRVTVASLKDCPAIKLAQEPKSAPALELTLVIDPLCSHCQDLVNSVRELQRKRPGKIATQIVVFPLGHDCKTISDKHCAASAQAIDYLSQSPRTITDFSQFLAQFNGKKISVEKIAAPIKSKRAEHVSWGKKQNIFGLPALFVDNHRFIGVTAPDHVEEICRRVLSSKLKERRAGQ